MRATQKQIGYLQYVLDSEGLELGNFTSKDIHSLSHKEVKEILDKIGVPITPNLKDYRYIIDHQDPSLGYIVGRQLSVKKGTEMKVICFMDMVVIDWDNVNRSEPSEGVSCRTSKDELLDRIKCHLSQFPYTFYIYETQNGFHGYIMSERMFYGNYQTIKLLENLLCDQFYIGFTRKVGFVVRIQKKEGREERFIERFVCQVNNFPILEELQQLVKIKDSHTCL